MPVWLFPFEPLDMEQMRPSKPLTPANDTIENFHATNARSSNDDDAARLHQVFEATGYGKINRLVREVFAAKLP